MAKGGVILDKGTRDELAKASKNILAVPVLKEKLLNVLPNEISKDKVNELLSQPDNLKNLSEDEVLYYIGGLYKTTLNETLNPAKIFVTNKELKNKFKKEMYNAEFKEDFISRYNDSTQRVVRVMFKKTAILERAYGKDLYDFSLEEFQDVLKSLEAKTVRSLQNSIIRIRQYISYALERKVTSVEANYADIFNSASRIEPFLSKKSEEIVYTRQEIMTMAMHTENAQDGAIIALLFDGVNNKNQFHELVNLKKEHIDFNEQTATIHGEDGIRKIKMSTETCILVKDAIEQDEYISINNENYRKYEVCKSDYVFRGLRSNAQVKWRNINERIARIAKANDEELNATNVVYSGQLYYLKNILNEVTLEQGLRSTLDKFGLPINESSLHSLKKRYEKFGKKL